MFFFHFEATMINIFPVFFGFIESFLFARQALVYKTFSYNLCITLVLYCSLYSLIMQNKMKAIIAEVNLCWKFGRNYKKSWNIPWDPPRKLYSKERRNYLPPKNIVMNRAILFDMWKQRKHKRNFLQFRHQCNNSRIRIGYKITF